MRIDRGDGALFDRGEISGQPFNVGALLHTVRRLSFQALSLQADETAQHVDPDRGPFLLAEMR